MPKGNNSKKIIKNTQASYKQIETQKDIKGSNTLANMSNESIYEKNQTPKSTIKKLPIKKNGDCTKKKSSEVNYNTKCSSKVVSERVLQFSEEKPGHNEVDNTNWQECENQLESLYAKLNALENLAFYNLKHHTENFARDCCQFDEKKGFGDSNFEESALERLQEEMKALRDDKVRHWKFSAKFGAQKFKLIL